MRYLTTKHARNQPNKTAIVFNDARLSFKELNDRVCRLANGLLSLGAGKGDRVGMLMTNCHQYVEFYFACFKIGAIATPINFRFVGSEITYVMNNAGIKILLTGKAFLKTIDEIKEDLPSLQRTICIDDKGDDTIGYEDLLESSSENEPVMDLDDDEVIFLGYTSGTTGQPKGAMLTHRNILCSSQAIVFHREMTPKDTYLFSAPLFHVAASGGMMATLFCGAKNVILDRFDPETVLETCQREKVTMAILIPTMISVLLDFHHLDRYDLSSLRKIPYGAAPMPPALIKRAMQVFDVEFNQAYGQR